MRLQPESSRHLTDSFQGMDATVDHAQRRRAAESRLLLSVLQRVR
jgi:hypothetical protein